MLSEGWLDQTVLKNNLDIGSSCVLRDSKPEDWGVLSLLSYHFSPQQPFPAFFILLSPSVPKVAHSLPQRDFFPLMVLFTMEF